MANSIAKETAQNIVNKAGELGFFISAYGTVLCLIKRIPTNNPKAFAAAETDANSIFNLIPRTSPGSIWGSTGDGAGGLNAMEDGIFELNKSGCSKLVINWIKKL